MMVHSALGCGDILFVGVKLKISELDVVLKEQSLDIDIKLSDVIIAGTSSYTSCVCVTNIR